MIFKFSSRIFFTYLPIYRRLLVSYIARIFCICIHICNRYYFPLLLFLRWKATKKISVSFWIKFATTYRCDLGAGIVKPFFCLNGFTQENRIISQFKSMFLSYRNNLINLHDTLNVGVLYDGKSFYFLHVHISPPSGDGKFAKA